MSAIFGLGSFMNIALKRFDKSIFAAAHAFKEAEARYAACAARCDVPGMAARPEDEAELDAAMVDCDDAEAILREPRPETIAGAHAVLDWMATHKSLSREAASAAAANLLSCPAL